MSSKIIYLHGFNSSPDGHKAQLLLAHMTAIGQQDNLYIPALSPYPSYAVKQISSLISNQGLDHSAVKLCLIGSSLGGYYATWFAEKHHCAAILINPSVKPYETLAEYIGENENYYTEEKWEFNHSHIQQLLDVDVKTITLAKRYFVLLQTGDEVLDYRQAKEKFAGSKLYIEEGGNHSFLAFEKHIDSMLAFSAL